MNFDDIGYNFLVGGDGAVYEGRGWDVVGALTRHYNSDSIGLGFIGDYQDLEPTEKQIEATQKLLDFGVKHHKLAKDYKLFGQCQLRENWASPGKMLYLMIKKWSHWSSENKFHCDHVD